MAVARIDASVQWIGLEQMLKVFKTALGPKERADLLEVALERAIDPVLQRLYETTPIGPTGNLSRARESKVVKYYNNGVAVGLVGFRRAAKEASKSARGGAVRSGPDRAFHQYWLEEGTDHRYVSAPTMTPYTRKAHVRRTKTGETTVRSHLVSSQGGYIASSYYKLGAFKIEKTSDPKRVTTNPGYPNAFFKKSGSPIIINPMPIGGRTGRPPLDTAWRDMQSRVAEYLAREIGASFEQVFSGMSYSSRGSIG